MWFKIEEKIEEEMHTKLKLRTRSQNSNHTSWTLGLIGALAFHTNHHWWNFKPNSRTHKQKNENWEYKEEEFVKLELEHHYNEKDAKLSYTTTYL